MDSVSQSRQLESPYNKSRRRKPRKPRDRFVMAAVTRVTSAIDVTSEIERAVNRKDVSQQKRFADLTNAAIYMRSGEMLDIPLPPLPRSFLSYASCKT